MYGRRPFGIKVLKYLSIIFGNNYWYHLLLSQKLKNILFLP